MEKVKSPSVFSTHYVAEGYCSGCHFHTAINPFTADPVKALQFAILV